MNKRLLIITRHRLCENNGGSNGSKGFIRCFAELFDDCSLIYPEIEDTTPFIPSKYKLYPCHDGRSKIRKGLDCYRGVLSPLAGQAEKHLRNHRYDVVVIDHSFISTPSLLKAIKRSGAKLITIHHNVERDYQHDNRKDYSLLFRYPYIHFAKKAERDCLLNSDVNLTVTEGDAETFRSWYSQKPKAKSQKPKAIYNWGNFEYRPIADKTFPQKDGSLQFIITGSLFFIQSLTPIIDFVANYWPLVTKAYPAAKLTIAGRNPAKTLKDICDRDKNITIVPNPEDMESLVQQANYYVCPINVGSGRKLRVMDGLKQGLPVLCHQVAVAGYECMEEKRCLFPYHDEQSFVKALHDMISATISPETVYSTFKANYSTEAGIEKLCGILHQEHII